MSEPTPTPVPSPVATLSAVQQLAGGQAIDYAKVQTAVDQALASYTLTLTKAGS